MVFGSFAPLKRPSNSAWRQRIGFQEGNFPSLIRNVSARCSVFYNKVRKICTSEIASTPFGGVQMGRTPSGMGVQGGVPLDFLCSVFKDYRAGYTWPFTGVGPIPLVPFPRGEGEDKYKRAMPSLTSLQQSLGAGPLWDSCPCATYHG